MANSEGYYGVLRGWQHRRHGAFELSDIPDLHGKIALVTGANGGIGKVAAHVLAQKHAKVFLACRSRDKAEKAMAEIRETSPDADLEFIAYDASSLQAAYSTAENFLEKEVPLDILILNAGAIIDKVQGSEDGLEWMFAVNHMAHFVLTMGLLPAIRRASRKDDVRIVATTSAGHNMHPDPSSLHIGDDELSVQDSTCWFKGAMPMYGRSKSCNILFSTELSRRLRELDWGHKVRVNAVHPGTISTGLNTSLRTGWYFYILESLVYFFAAIPTDRGAMNLLYAATSVEVRNQDITGKYLTPYGYVNSAPEKAAAGDAVFARQLWERSIELSKKFVPGFPTLEAAFC